MGDAINTAIRYIDAGDVDGFIHYFHTHRRRLKYHESQLLQAAVQAHDFTSGASAAIAEMLLPLADPEMVICDFDTDADAPARKEDYDAEREDRGLLEYSLRCGQLGFAYQVLAHPHYFPDSADLQEAIALQHPNLAEAILHKIGPQRVLGEALKPPRPNLLTADFAYKHGAKLTEIQDPAPIVLSGSIDLLRGWITCHKDNYDYAMLLMDGITLATEYKRRTMVEILLEELTKQPGTLYYEDSLVPLLCGEDGNDVLLPALECGKVVANPGDFTENVDVVKCLTLGKRYDPANVTLFDSLVAKLQEECGAHEQDTDTDAKGKFRYLRRRLHDYKTFLDRNDILNNSNNFKEFAAFARVMGLAYQLAEHLDPSHPQDQLSPLFVTMMVRSEGSWPAVCQNIYGQNYHGSMDAERTCRRVEDCVEYMARTLLIPELVRRAANQGTLQTMDIRAATEMLMPHMARQILGNRSLENLIGVCDEWHRRLNDYMDLRMIHPDCSWPALAPEYTAPNGLTVRFLTNSQELVDEGHALAHCSGTKTDDCYNSAGHMASIRSQGKPVATSFMWWQKGMRVPRVTDDAVRGNTRIPEGSPPWFAMQAFLADFEAKNIPLNLHAVEAAHREVEKRRRTCNVDNLEHWIGFDPFCIPPQAKTVEVWSDRNQPPERHEYPNVEDGIFLKFVHTSLRGKIPLIAGGKRLWENEALHGSRNPHLDYFLQKTGLTDVISAISQSPPRVGPVIEF